MAATHHDKMTGAPSHRHTLISPEQAGLLPKGLWGWSIGSARRKQGSFGIQWQLSSLQDARLLCHKVLCARRCHTKECFLVPPALPAFTAAGLTSPSMGGHCSPEHPPKAPRRAMQAAKAALPSLGRGKPLALAATSNRSPPEHRAGRYSDFPGSLAGSTVLEGEWMTFLSP